MCDSFVVLPHLTAAGGMLFAKNSDRERNEAQALEMNASATHPDGAVLKATYISIPQAARTHACLLSRPCWMWGAEMGANEYGVVIGNEAMHAVVPPQQEPALTGMDLVRLGLERAASASEAVDVIASLLERYGQGGNCGHLHPFFYHNGFLIADGREAYVLETVGRDWACERVRDQRALSNAYSIARGYDRLSAGLERQAQASGWTDEEGRFDFAARMIDEARDQVSFGRGRCARGSALLARQAGWAGAHTMMDVLRDHGEEGESPGWTPEKTLHRSICMHAAGGERRSQTTASWVVSWRGGRAVHWVTASSAPCLSIFKPALLDADFPSDTDGLSDRFDPAYRWWRHEVWHRRALSDYHDQAKRIAAERDQLEALFIAQVAEALDAGADRVALSAVIAACWSAADDAEARWLAAPELGKRDLRLSAAYADSWREHDALAGIPSR